MKYQMVTEIESYYNIEKMMKLTRLLWYKIAEGIELIPNSYVDFTRIISEYESNFNGWKLNIKDDGSLSLMKLLENGRLYIQIDRSGKETYQILPIA